MSIELQDISKTFIERTLRALLPGARPRRIEALRGISLAVKEGEIVGLLGPNGAGKTTLIKILATLVAPDSGTGKVQGFDLIAEPDRVRNVIGLVNTSERSFYWRLTGRQNLLFFAALWGLNGSEARRRVDEIFDLLGLSDKADVRFMKYSTGQQQRLALARALIPDPPVLLMDEPTRSLDPVGASDLRRFVKQDLSKRMRKTILWCTHNLKEAEEICDRLVFIHKGAAIASGTLGEMRCLLGPQETFYIRADRLPDAALPQQLMVDPVQITRNNGFVEGIFNVAADRVPVLLKELVNQGIEIYACAPQQIPLETIFERIIGRATE